MLKKTWITNKPCLTTAGMWWWLAATVFVEAMAYIGNILLSTSPDNKQLFADLYLKPQPKAERGVSDTLTLTRAIDLFDRNHLSKAKAHLSIVGHNRWSAINGKILPATSSCAQKLPDRFLIPRTAKRATYKMMPSTTACSLPSSSTKKMPYAISTYLTNLNFRKHSWKKVEGIWGENEFLL